MGDDPKAWLQELELPDANAVEVRYKGVDVGNRFFKKVFIRYEFLLPFGSLKPPMTTSILCKLILFHRCDKPSLENLARRCRLQGVLGSRDENGHEGKEARRWAEQEYDPHASVL